MSRAGVPSDHAERVLGHAITGVEAVYDRHSYADEKADALEKLAALVATIVNPPTGANVVSLRREDFPRKATCDVRSRLICQSRQTLGPLLAPEGAVFGLSRPLARSSWLAAPWGLLCLDSRRSQALAAGRNANVIKPHSPRA